MADKKFSDLNALTSLSAADLLAIVDNANNETKKITMTNFFGTVPVDIKVSDGKYIGIDGAERMQFNAAGTIQILGITSLIIPDNAYIGSASVNDALRIRADGDIDLTQDLTVAGKIIIADAGNIGSVSDTDAIAISAGGNVTLTQNLLMANGNYVGISAAERIEFYTAGYVSVMGAKFGVGIASPDGTLHAHTATAGSVTADGSADDIVAENSDNCGISILSPDEKQGNFVFGSPNDSSQNWLRSFQSATAGNRYMSFSVNNAECVRIDSSGNVVIGDTAADTKVSKGLTINQGANDDLVIAFQSSDISQPATDSADADTYGFAKKCIAGTGGLSIRGLSEAAANYGIQMIGYAGTADNTTTVNAIGCVQLTGYESDGGTGHQAIGDNDNIVVMENGINAKHIFKGDGDIYTDTDQTSGLTGQYDNEDDLALLAAAKDAMVGIYRDMWKTATKRLNELGIMKGTFYSHNRMNALQLGAFGQIDARLKKIEVALGL